MFRQLKRLPGSRLEPVPAELRETVKLMLNVAPDLRPDAHQFAKVRHRMASRVIRPARLWQSGSASETPVLRTRTSVVILLGVGDTF